MYDHGSWSPARKTAGPDEVMRWDDLRQAADQLTVGIPRPLAVTGGAGGADEVPLARPADGKLGKGGGGVVPRAVTVGIRTGVEGVGACVTDGRRPAVDGSVVDGNAHPGAWIEVIGEVEDDVGLGVHVQRGQGNTAEEDGGAVVGGVEMAEVAGGGVVVRNVVEQILIATIREFLVMDVTLVKPDGASFTLEPAREVATPAGAVSWRGCHEPISEVEFAAFVYHKAAVRDACRVVDL